MESLAVCVGRRIKDKPCLREMQVLPTSLLGSGLPTIPPATGAPLLPKHLTGAHKTPGADYSTIGQRIRRARKAAELTQAQVADGLGVSRVSVTQWESGTTTPEREHVRRLAALLNTTPENLEFGLDVSPEKRLHFRRVPLIQWSVVNKNPTSIASAIRASNEAIPCPVECGPQTFALPVRGLSMAGSFREGEYIFVDPDVLPTHRRFVVAVHNGEPVLRQYIDEGASRYLVASNPDIPSRILAIDADTQIVGTVVFRGERV
jgi:SOS-response transcriptional repressor LexA